MSRADPPPRRYDTHAQFLAADARRQQNALELGHDWHDGEHRCRVCWYQQTGELTLERLATPTALTLEDFHHGVTGPTEILAIIPAREQLTRVLGDWPAIATHQPQAADWLKARLQHVLTPRSTD